MTESHKKATGGSKWLLLTAALLIFPLYATIVWFTSWKGELSQAENVAGYLGFFPGFLRGTSAVTWLSLLLSIAASVAAILAFKWNRTSVRWLAIPLLVIGILLMLWLGFTLL